MGICQSTNTSSNRKSSINTMVFEKDPQTIRENTNASSSNSSGSENQMIHYFCSKKNKSFDVSLTKFENYKSLPCGCLRRRDISMENFKKKINENYNIGKQCDKHKHNLCSYCFECEIDICDLCKDAFHDEYFNNHHLIL